jgi:hypothetical protein
MPLVPRCLVADPACGGSTAQLPRDHSLEVTVDPDAATTVRGQTRTPPSALQPQWGHSRAHRAHGRRRPGQHANHSSSGAAGAGHHPTARP